MATKRTVEVELSTTGMDRQGRPQRVPLVTSNGSAVALEAPPALEPGMDDEHMLINIGPQHPATHGVLRLVLEMEGETIVRCIPHVGYLHCGFEKIGEYRQYNQIIPWTDREDYLNSMGNNIAFALGAERLFGIEITERCKVLRVIGSGTPFYAFGAYHYYYFYSPRLHQCNCLQYEWSSPTRPQSSGLPISQW